MEGKISSSPEEESDSHGDVSRHYFHSDYGYYGSPPPPPTKVSLTSSDSIFSSDVPDMTPLVKDVQKMSSLEKRLAEQEILMVKQSSAMSTIIFTRYS